MPLSENEFSALVDAGCTDCGGKKLSIEAWVAQKLPLLGGELYGAASWAYKGEDLVRGTFLIACTGCKKALFTATPCPRCQAEGGVARALEQENAFPLPPSCAHCGSERLTATALVPAVVLYEGKRASKARTHVAQEDPGFHVFRAECIDCHTVEERRAPCPLCGS